MKEREIFREEVGGESTEQPLLKKLSRKKLPLLGLVTTVLISPLEKGVYSHTVEAQEPASISADIVEYKEQIPPEKYAELKFVKKDKKIDRTLIYYFGSRQREMNSIPDLERKFSSVARGVLNIEQLLDQNLVDTVAILGSNVGAEGVFAHPLRQRIIFYAYRNFRDENENYIFHTGEHETIHRFIFERRYHKNKRLASLFNFVNLTNDQRLFLDFISEYNYIGFRPFSFGHAFDNIHEFLASFMHSLMHIELLRESLSKPINMKKSGVGVTVARSLEEFRKLLFEVRHLTAAEQMNILDRYIGILRILRRAAVHGSAEESLFEQGLREVRKIKKEKEKVMHFR